MGNGAYRYGNAGATWKNGITLAFEPVNALRANLEAFADAIEGGAEYPISTAQMVDVIAGLEAIVASMESGKAVTLADGES